MLKNVLSVILFLAAPHCFAQQNYFVLIQADNNQPFYARINGKTLSSSDIGHLIIPQLKDTLHPVTIGFPKNIYPEQNFVIAINKKDQSFQLKNLGEKGWALFNTKTMELKMPVKTDTVAPKQISAEPAKKEDAFARLMAGVVNDTSIMHNNIVEEDEPAKKETVNEPKSTDADNKKDSSKTIAKNKVDENKTVQKQIPSVSIPAAKKEGNIKSDTLNKPITKTKAPLYRAKDTTATRTNLSFIKKLSEEKTDSAYQMRFADIPGKGAIDTVDVIIPLNNEPIVTGQKKDTIRKFPEEISNKETKAQKTRDTIRKLIDTGVAVTKKADESIKKDSAQVQIKTPEAAVNKDCKSFASDYDIDKLRVKIMAIDNDDDRISAARTIFKLKCFSVKQVRALSEIFKTDEGKYKLFDATYMHVSDKENFILLQSLLSDQYYVNRFKAMIR